ncbi:MAG: AAA family ATPase [Moraxella sp.]|nr:AAA family ATPase [Moraxella sp.]
MRLKSLKLNGFKSFANPTTFTFKHDITAIVGPNGCGKSNVIDAIRWVLGETSAKQLRGGAMSDVIFAGVEGRAGKSLASVELTFEHTQDERTGIRHALNLYHELTLRRQINKDGKSDYFINGQRVRRRDVVDVFLGTGLGSRSYAVIEQGMIGRIIDADGARLREFIEESAGVSRYQARRAETQKQLDDTHDNLQRLTDLQSELTKQQKTLARQAKSAKRYQALTDEMATLQKDELLKRIFMAWQYLNEQQTKQANFAQTLVSLEQNVATVKHTFDEQHQKMTRAAQLKDELREKYHNARMAQKTAEHNFYQLNQQLEQTDDKLSRLIVNQKTAQDRAQNAQNELGEIQVALAKIVPDLEVVKAEIDDYQTKLDGVQRAWQNAKADTERLTAMRQTLDGQKQLAQAGQHRLAVARQKWQKRHDELIRERQSLDKMQIDKGQITTLRAELDGLTVAINQIHLNDDKRTFDDIARQVGAIKGELAILEKRHASLTGEYDTLNKLVHTKKTTPTPTTGDAYQYLTTLKDEICLSRAGERFGAVLDGFLGFWLDAKMGDVSCVDIIKTNPKTPTAIFYPSTHTPSVDGNFIPLNTLIESPKLALFDHVYLYTGQGVPSVGDGRIVLTQTGWIVGSFGTVQVSKFGSKSDFLSQKTEHLQRLGVLKDEIMSLADQMDTHRQRLKALNEQKFRLKDDLDTQTARRATLIDKKHRTEQALIRLEADLNNHALKLENIAKNQSLLDSEKAEHDAEMIKFAQDVTHADNELNVLMPNLQSAQAQSDELGEQIRHLNHLIQDCQDKAQALALQYQSLLQKQDHENTLFELAKTTQATTDGDIQATQTTKEALLSQLPKLQNALHLAKDDCTKQQAQSDEHDRQLAQLQQAHDECQERLALAQNDLSLAHAQVVQAGADVAVAQSRLDDLGGQMLGVDNAFDLPSTLADFGVNPPSFADHAKRLDEIKEELDNIGAVNLTAITELGELENRLLPMTAQIKDITDSMDTLKQAIKDIDETTKSLFLDRLQAVNDELNALFVKIFGGGQASLTLMDDDALSKTDKWRAGLVLMAQPKGKKNSRLAVLSGGEKTLTALSLIFAIFKQHPAPFCVLDEVDAPLDDANVGRFTSLIHELADSVQFIFISHNKLAMQTAHELKGITMPTAGISRLVTVNLHEAQQYVDG